MERRVWRAERRWLGGWQVEISASTTLNSHRSPCSDPWWGRPKGSILPNSSTGAEARGPTGPCTRPRSGDPLRIVVSALVESAELSRGLDLADKRGGGWRGAPWVDDRP